MSDTSKTTSPLDHVTPTDGHVTGSPSVGRKEHNLNPGAVEQYIYIEMGLKKLFNRTLSPMFLILFLCLFGPISVWYVSTQLDGSYSALYWIFRQQGILGALGQIWKSVNICSTFSVSVILGYMTFAYLLMRFVPGPKVSGPVTPMGNMPAYVDNGFRCYVITMVTFVALTFTLKCNNLTPTVIYDHFGDFLGTLNIIGLVLCLILYFKGIYRPDSSDCGTTGNVMFDYYWGTELHPQLLGVDVKIFTNCRFGMTVWPLMCLVYALKNYELYGFVDSMFVTLALQLVYITKFFWWEAGYYSTIDIMLDRAGYYICWGCIVIVPSFYPSVSLYLANHPVHLGLYLTLTFLSAGLLSIAVNYWADWQKMVTRQTKGNCLIWGRRAEVVTAQYIAAGKTKHSLLLVSGFWGVSRHFHYLPELILALCWTLPALFTHYCPYLYLTFLTILLIHRTYRDDTKCKNKYGKYWDEYCERVPYKIIPCVY